MNKLSTNRNDWTIRPKPKDTVQEPSSSEEEWDDDDEWDTDDEPTKISPEDQKAQDQSKEFYTEFANRATKDSSSSSSSDSDSDSEIEAVVKPKEIFMRGDRVWDHEAGDRYSTDMYCKRDVKFYFLWSGSAHSSMLIIRGHPEDIATMSDGKIAAKFGLKYLNLQKRKNPFSGFTAPVTDEPSVLPTNSSSDENSDDENSGSSDENSDENSDEEEVNDDPLGNKTAEVYRGLKVVSTPKFRIRSDPGDFDLFIFYEKKDAPTSELRKKAKEVIDALHAAKCAKSQAETDRKKTALERCKEKSRKAQSAKNGARKIATKTKDPDDWKTFNVLKDAAKMVFVHQDDEYVSAKGIKKHRGHADKGNKKKLAGVAKVYYNKVTLDI